MAATREFREHIDLRKNILSNVRIHNVTNAERVVLGTSLNANYKGILVFDTEQKVLYTWDGVSWVSSSGSSNVLFNGRPGPNIFPTIGDYVTDMIPEGAVNKYFTIGRVRTALSQGAGISYSQITGVISSTITQYTDENARDTVSAMFQDSDSTTIGIDDALDTIEVSVRESWVTGLFNHGDGLTYDGTGVFAADLTFFDDRYLQITGANFVPLTRTITINGETYDLSADRIWNITLVNELSGLDDVDLAGVSGNMFLYYNAGTSKWKARNLLASDIPDLSATYVLTSQLASYQLLSQKATNFSVINNTFYPTTQAVANYVTGFNYLTSITSLMVTTALGYTPYNSTNPSGYITSSALSPYLTISSASATYQPLLGYTPYNSTNPDGYITSAALSGYLTSAAATGLYFPLVGGTLTGTAGSGFIGLPTQSSAPTGVSGAVRVYSDASGRLSWITSLGFSRTFSSSALTANRIYTLPDRSITVAGTDELTTAISLNTTGVLFNSPVTFSPTGTTWSGALTLANVSGPAIFGKFTTGSGTPSYNGPTTDGQLLIRRSGGLSWDTLTPTDIPDISATYQTYGAATAGFVMQEDFLNTTGNFTSHTSGVLTNVAQTAFNRAGVIRMSTSTTATGRAGVGSGPVSNPSAFLLGAGTWTYETTVNVSTALSTSSERYQFMSGFLSVTNGSLNQTAGVYFLYDEGGITTGSAASPNWQCVTASSSSRTFVTTSTAVSNATWIKLKIIVTKTLGVDTAYFYIDGVLITTITANLPITLGNPVGWANQIVKSVGTTARTIDCDYSVVNATFTTPR